MDEYVEAYRNLNQFNLLPVMGDAADQPAFFQTVCDIMNTVRGYIDERNQEHADRMAKMRQGNGNGPRNQNPSLASN